MATFSFLKLANSNFGYFLLSYWEFWHYPCLDIVWILSFKKMVLGWISTVIATWRHSKTCLEVSFGLFFIQKKAAIIHCVHPLYSGPLHSSFIITTTYWDDFRTIGLGGGLARVMMMPLLLGKCTCEEVCGISNLYLTWVFTMCQWPIRKLYTTMLHKWPTVTHVTAS